jgi:N-alpha-acetyltransferase 50
LFCEDSTTPRAATMESVKGSLAQPSITSFFQPRLPSLKAPPLPMQTIRHGQPAQTRPAQPPPSFKPAPPPPAASSPSPSTLPILPPPPSLPPQANIVPIEQEHIEQLRRINALLLPVTYAESFYKGLLDPKVSGLLSRAITWQDKDASSSEPQVIGGLVCRIEPADQAARNGQQRHTPSPVPIHADGENGEHALYIQALALLSPYRSLGLAALALEHVLATAALLPAAGLAVNVRSVYAHVWIENEDGLRWYEKRAFRRQGAPVPGYYFKLRPDAAWLVRRDLGGVVGRENGKTAASNGAGAQPTAPTGAASSVVRPSPVPSLSFQKKGPEMEWNDLPADMVNRTLQVPGANGGGSGSVSPTGGRSSASSRSSSTARRKKDRAYPAAAFGS